MVISVILPFIRSGYDRKGLSLSNCKFAFYIFNVIVTSCFSDFRSTRHNLFGIFAYISLLTIQSDTCQRIASLKAIYSYFRIKSFCICCIVFALWMSIILISLIYSSNYKICFFNCQLTCYISNVVIISCITYFCCTRYDLSFIFACISLLTIQSNARQLVSSLKSCACNCDLVGICICSIIFALC